VTREEVADTLPQHGGEARPLNGDAEMPNNESRTLNPARPPGRGGVVLAVAFALACTSAGAAELPPPDEPYFVNFTEPHKAPRLPEN